MQRYLVVFDRDWADEFDVSGIKIMSQEEVDELKTQLENSPSWYFGTNEGFEDGELSVDDFTFTPITPEDEISFVKLLSLPFGNFPDLRQ